MSVKLIAHVLLICQGKYLLIKRSAIKRGQPNVYPLYWDIPGGSVELAELPSHAAVRECQEEVGIFLDANHLRIIYEDSQFDQEKQTVFTRLVYQTDLPAKGLPSVTLDPEEHLDYRWVAGLDDLEDQTLVPYLSKLLGGTYDTGF